MNKTSFKTINSPDKIYDFLEIVVNNLVESTKTTQTVYGCSMNEAFEIVIKDSAAGKKAIQVARERLGIL